MTSIAAAPSPARLRPWILSLAVSVLIAAILPFLTTNLDGKTIGDTDDAVRLMLVRDLLAGHGWFNVTLPAINPPQGLEMHWSRLLDGGIASLELLLGLVLPPDRAEFIARATAAPNRPINGRCSPPSQVAAPA